MTVLVLTNESPVPPRSGSRLRVLHLARQLSTAFDVEVVAPGPRVEEAVGLPFRLRLVEPPRSRGSALLRSLTRPYLAAKLDVAGLKRAAAERRWQTVQAVFPFTVRAALLSGAPVLLDAHNVETEVVRTVAASEPNAIRRARWRWEARKMARYESTAVRAAAAVCATSDGDAEILERWGASRIVVVPNGVAAGEIAFEEPEPVPRVLYVGYLAYRPNALAALELVDGVLPRVRAAIPDATARIVGRGAPPDLRRRASPAVEVPGEVADVLPEYRAAGVLVLPLRAGGGTRLKLLEAMAAGVPVVSTPLGAAGLDVRGGEHVLFGETAAELAEQTIRVLLEPELARGLARAARELVETKYDWQVVAKPLVELHHELGGTS